MLTIVHPATYLPERQYIYKVTLGEFLGLEFQTRLEERSDVGILSSSDDALRTLTVADSLFQTPTHLWLSPESMPISPLLFWNDSPLQHLFPNSGLPLLFKDKEPGSAFITQAGNQTRLNIDIFGTIFFYLSRYEEIAISLRDDHDRFPAAASLAFQQKILDRPVVNEYVELLWHFLKLQWPGLQRRVRQHQVILSCDVDAPRCDDFKTPVHALRRGFGDIVKRRSPSLAARRLVAYSKNRPQADLCYTFDFIMDLAEKYNFPQAFYFITDHTAGEIDGSYSVDEAWIRQLLRNIHARGHEIGLHPSYGTFRDSQQTQQEFATLRQVATSEEINQNFWGGRQHYLRWENPGTWQNWADAGLAYDTTLSFADHVGFRCGTCYEYPVFNLKTRQELALRERPLIVMEGSLFSANYMNVTLEVGAEKILALNAICKRFSGNFTLLWHNSSLVTGQQKAAYREILKALADP